MGGRLSAAPRIQGVARQCTRLFGQWRHVRDGRVREVTGTVDREHHGVGWQCDVPLHCAGLAVVLPIFFAVGSAPGASVNFTTVPLA